MTDSEQVACVNRIRTQLRDAAAELKALSVQISDPRLMPGRLKATELVLIWKDQIAAMSKAPDVTWEEALGETMVEVDPALLAIVFRELADNAHAFGVSKLCISARIENQRVIFEQHEPRTGPVDTKRWGDAPLETTHRGGDHVIVVGRVEKYVRYGGNALLYAPGRYAVAEDHPMLLLKPPDHLLRAAWLIGALEGHRARAAGCEAPTKAPRRGGDDRRSEAGWRGVRPDSRTCG